MNKTVLIIIVVYLLTINLSAQTTSTSTSSGTKYEISFRPKAKPIIATRPKAPSMQSVECVYEDGMLYFTFNYSEGASMLYIYDSTQTTMLGQHQLYTDFESAVYVGDLNDVYLCIVTSYGNEYEGWLY